MMGAVSLSAEDREEIRDLYTRYSFGMDRGDRDLFASVWAEDAHWVCEAISLDVTGRDRILEFHASGPGAAAPMPLPGGSIRIAGHPLITVVDGEARGLAEFVAHRFTGDVVHTYSVGYYEDRFVRTDDGWRIRQRIMVTNTPVPVR
jgi:hypothetical protein